MTCPPPRLHAVHPLHHALLQAGLALAGTLCTLGSGHAALLTGYPPPYPDCCNDDWQTSSDAVVSGPTAPGAPGTPFSTLGYGLLGGKGGSVDLAPGNDYLLTVFVENVSGSTPGFFGLYTLGAGFEFACNHARTLATTTTPGCWQASLDAIVSTALLPPPAAFEPMAPLVEPTAPYVAPTGTPSSRGNYDDHPLGGVADPVLAGQGVQYLWATHDTPLPAADGVHGTAHVWFSTRINAVPVPEPGSALLAGIGLLALVAGTGRARQRR